MAKNQEHFDVTVLEMRKQFEERQKIEEEERQLKEQPLDIRSEKALINEDMISFQRLPMMEQNISMIVPEGMKELEEEGKKIIYEEDYQPQFFYTNHDGSITISFDALFEDVEEDDFLMVRKEMIRGFRKEFEDFSLKWEEAVSWQNVPFYYFIKKVKGETGLTYNITFQFLVRGFLVMGSLTLMGHRINDWKEAAFQMVESLQLEEPEQEEA